MPLPPFAADTRAIYDDLAGLYLPIALAVFAVFAGLLILLPLRGRRRARPAAGRDEHTPLELAYVLVLVAIAAFLVVRTFSAEADIDSKDARPGLAVRVIGAKWTWRFEYPRLGIVVQGGDRRRATLVVPAATEVEFSATSRDVAHGFWIPEARFQRTLFPGRTTRFRLRFDDPGMSTGSAPCSFYCGLGHRSMTFAVRVLPRAQFEAWASRERP